MTHTSIEGATGSSTGRSAWPAAVPELDALFLETIGTPAGRRDPYSRYRALREAAPVYASGMGFTVCTRYDECQFVLRDPRFGKDATERDAQLRARFAHLEMSQPIEEISSDRRSLLFLNPPDHTRLRALVSKAFTPRTVERLRPEICSLVDGLLDRLPVGEAIDVMEALSFPLPVAVIGRMLGVPEADWPRFRRVMGRATLLLEPVIDDADVEPALRAQVELAEYFTALVAKRRRAPADDLISELIAVEEGSDRLDEIELISTAILIFGAGFETTTNLIGNGLLALLTHPEELGRLRSELASGEAGGSVMRRAVEELLRYDSPVQFDGREAFEDVDISGVTARAGSEVITVLG
ncbi:MAG: cytochrome P450, partial [Acidimicrobiales bacterium]